MKYILPFFFLLQLTACKKDEGTNSNNDARGILTVAFDQVVGSDNLVLGTSLYFNSSNEPFRVDVFRYYVSNFMFTREDGTIYTVPQDSSYFLIDELNSLSHIASFNLPVGTYKNLQFTIGVDSLRSTMNIADRTGVLDPTTLAGDMYWGWNSGYVFLKMEGRSDVAQPDGSYAYHIGGFGGYSAPTINNIRTVTLNLQEKGFADVRLAGTSKLMIATDVLKLFDGTEDISISANPDVMFTPYSTTISANYSQMFSHVSTEND